MKEFLQTLQDAFPILRNHPIFIARVTLLLIGLVSVYSPKELRKRICLKLYSRLYSKIVSTSRWLYVYQNSNSVNDWKYYTTETSGKGNTGDDVIWKLVEWPSLKTIDAFTVPGAVGMLDGIHNSQAILAGRWNVIHDPDSLSVGRVPALGVISKVRQVSAKALYILGEWGNPSTPDQAKIAATPTDKQLGG